MTTYHSIPWRTKAKAETHDSIEEAQTRALRISARTGDWVAVVTKQDDKTISTKYVHPPQARRR